MTNQEQLTWIDSADQFKTVKAFKAFVAAKTAFEAECREKLNARAFSYRQGKISVGCASAPKTVIKANGKTIDPASMVKLMALAKELGIG